MLTGEGDAGTLGSVPQKKIGARLSEGGFSRRKHQPWEGQRGEKGGSDPSNCAGEKRNRPNNSVGILNEKRSAKRKRILERIIYGGENGDQSEEM